MTLSAKRIALVHVAVARLALDDDAYRAILRTCGGVESSRDLNDDSFDEVMAYFERLGFKSDFNRRNLGNRAGMASPAQVAKLRGLWSEYTAGQGSDASLGKWLYRQFKISELRFLTTDKAQKAIGALTVMVAKRKIDRDPQSVA